MSRKISMVSKRGMQISVHNDEHIYVKKLLTMQMGYAIILEHCHVATIFGGIAQLARAFGSYPTGRWFKSDFRYHIRPVGQEVKTPPFHGSNMGSIPVYVTIRPFGISGR